MTDWWTARRVVSVGPNAIPFILKNCIVRFVWHQYPLMAMKRNGYCPKYDGLFNSGIQGTQELVCVTCVCLFAALNSGFCVRLLRAELLHGFYAWCLHCLKFPLAHALRNWPTNMVSRMAVQECAVPVMGGGRSRRSLTHVKRQARQPQKGPPTPRPLASAPSLHEPRRLGIWQMQ